MERTIVQKNAQRGRLLRGLRKIHGWLGLWGAVLGLLFGVSGFLLNHRAVMKIPAARMEATEIQLAMAQPYPQDQKAFVRYIQQALDISQAPARPKGRPPQKQAMAQTSEPARHGKVEDQAARQTSVAGMGSSGAPAREATSMVKTAGKAEHDARFMGQAMKQPAVWTVEFQLPQAAIKAEYIPGNQYARVERQDANIWGFITRMHKGVGANVAWVLLADTIAGAMLLLSITGVLLWTKMRGSRLAMAGLIGGSLVATILTTLSML